MFRVNALFEAWLREATEKPLASWKRTALLWRLQEDADLRVYAAELAEFSHETEPDVALTLAEQTWMRDRLQARLKEVGRGTLADAWGAWLGPVLGLGLGVAVLALVLNSPQRPSTPLNQGADANLAGALTLPSPTPTQTQTPGPVSSL